MRGSANARITSDCSIGSRWCSCGTLPTVPHNFGASAQRSLLKCRCQTTAMNLTTLGRHGRLSRTSLAGQSLIAASVYGLDPAGMLTAIQDRYSDHPPSVHFGTRQSEDLRFYHAAMRRHGTSTLIAHNRGATRLLLRRRLSMIAAAIERTLMNGWRVACGPLSSSDLPNSAAMESEEVLRKLAAGELPVSEASKLLAQASPVLVGESDAECDLYLGIDSDIANLFFNLDSRSTELIFKHYERDYGRSARDYAVKTYSDWRRGKVGISGKVADRLVAIVPHYISFDEKYAILEKYWKKQPKRRIHISVTPCEDVPQVRQRIIEGVEAVAVDDIPESVQHRLAWLTASDTQVAQQLLKRLHAEERRLVMEAITREVEAVAHLVRANSASMIRSSHSFSFPGVEICVTVEDPAMSRKPVAAEGCAQSAAWICAALIGLAAMLYVSIQLTGGPNVEYRGSYIPLRAVGDNDGPVSPTTAPS